MVHSSKIAVITEVFNFYAEASFSVDIEEFCLQSSYSFLEIIDESGTIIFF